jgi:hypothetical protein
VKIGLSLSIGVVLIGVVAYWIWRRVQNSVIEAEIEKIKIPDDSFEELPAGKEVPSVRKHGE